MQLYYYYYLIIFAAASIEDSSPEPGGELHVISKFEQT